MLVFPGIISLVDRNKEVLIPKCVTNIFRSDYNFGELTSYVYNLSA